MLGHTAADKVYAFKSMKSWHTLAINMITVSVQGRIEGGFLRFQETPFDSPIIFKTA